jgi:FMN-dependent NADH-azoreductase
LPGCLVFVSEMRTLLRIDASSQSSASYSRALANYYEMQWRKCHPAGRVLTRDLLRNPVPHLDEATIAVFYSGGDVSEGTPPRGILLSDELVSELKQADDIVVSSALYNFSMPSALKAWIDHIVRFGHTIGSGERGPVGLLTGKSACFLTARGGNPSRSPDHQYPVLEAVFALIGITETRWISLEGTRIPDGGLDARMAAAQAAIDEVFSSREAAA